MSCVKIERIKLVDNEVVKKILQTNTKRKIRDLDNLCSPSDSFRIRTRCNTYGRDKYNILVVKTEEFTGA
jgi:uncharacterized protein YerC